MNGQLKELYEILHPGKQYTETTISVSKGDSEQEQSIRDALKDQGKSKNQPDDKYDLGQLTNGTFVETEHTDDLGAAKEIAKDHLEEDPEYYSKGDFPEEAEEAKEKILSDENCKDVYIKSKPYDAVLGCRANTILSGLAELIGGK